MRDQHAPTAPRPWYTQAAYLFLLLTGYVLGLVLGSMGAGASWICGGAQ